MRFSLKRSFNNMGHISSEEFNYKRPPLEDYLEEYNKLLAAILYKHYPSLEYIASATLNRLESQTHFYEKVEKYIQLREALSSDDRLTVSLEGDARFFYEELVSEFGPDRVHGKPHPKRRYMFFFKLIGNFIYTLILSVYGILSVKRKPRYAAVVRSYFDYRCRDSSGQLREEYFGPFFNDLKDNKTILVIFKLIHRSDLIRYIKLSRKSDFDNCILESMLTPGTVLNIFANYLLSRIKIDSPCIYKGTDITALLQRSLDEDYWSLRGIGVYVEYEAARKVMEHKPDYLFYPFENQSWEKVYPLVKHNNGGIKPCLIGFQHTGLSYKLLSYFPTEIDSKMPLFPDKLFTVGKILAQLLRTKAHYPCEIIEGAALRHHNLSNKGRFSVRRNNENDLLHGIAYAFSYDVSKYKSIIKALLEVFGDSDIRIYLKIHPDYREKDIVKRLKLSLPGNFILAQRRPWSEIYSKVDFVFYDDNSVGLEAIINGVRSFLFDVGEPIYNCDRLYYFSAWETALTKEQAYEMKENYGAPPYNKIKDSAYAEQYINEYYSAYSDRNSFKTKVECSSACNV